MDSDTIIGWLFTGGFLVAWIWFARFGIKKGWSKVAAIGGGFIVVVVSMIVVTVPFALVNKQSESPDDKSMSSTDGIWSAFSNGLDGSFFYCEHSIKDCEWHDVMDNVAACTFTNTASAPVNTRQFSAWSYSHSGVMLKNRAIGFDNVSPGRSVKVELMFDMKTDKGYVCSMDPESDIGKATLGTALKPLAIK